MGKVMGSNCHIMFRSHDTEVQEYLIIINIDTGKRIEIMLDPEKV